MTTCIETHTQTLVSAYTHHCDVTSKQRPLCKV